MLELPLRARVVDAANEIDAVRGCVAFERGPLVYCVEGMDLPAGVNLDAVSVDASTAPADRHGFDVSGHPVVALSLKGQADDVPPPHGWPYPELNGDRTSPSRCARAERDAVLLLGEPRRNLDARLGSAQRSLATRREGRRDRGQRQGRPRDRPGPARARPRRVERRPEAVRGVEHSRFPCALYVRRPDRLRPDDRGDLRRGAAAGIEAVVHLAAIPSPVHATADLVFRTNITSTHTVFAAATRLGLDRVVWASSETTLGLPFDRPPDYAPIDEEHELRPESSYALSKVLGEEMARQFNRRSGITFVGLRYSNIMERADYERFPSFWDDPSLRKWNLWSYVDESHVADATCRALEAEVAGADSFIIAAADSVMQRPSGELMAEVYPGVPVRRELGEHETLLAIDKARNVLGYNPVFTWRDVL